MDQTDQRYASVDPLTRIRLTLLTAGRLQPRQLVGVVDRTVRHGLVPRLPVDFDRRYEQRIPETLRVSLRPLNANTEHLRASLTTETRQSFASKLDAFDRGRLEFLGREVTLDADRTVAWDDSQLDGAPLLWWLKYQSLAVLKWFVLGEGRPARAETFVSETLDPWMRAIISSTEIGSPDYLRRDWIPHAVSLRVLRLCRYCAWLAAHGMLSSRGFLLKYLYKNALFLRNHVERDVGGNHLVENAAALLAAGLLFGNADWEETGRRLFVDTAEAQFLDDGGHFERSPMYHLMVLTRFLTAVDLLEKYGEAVPTIVHETTQAATGFLRALSPPDERIPLLNDAVFGEMFSLSEVLQYADAQSLRHLDGASENDSDNGVKDGPLGASGYFWLGTGDDRLLVDCGAVGPPHLPGHSHVDVLSVMLWLDGQRVLTDTGVYQYADDGRRVYARSARAHNTVEVGDHGPITVGGQYLMGTRVEPTVTEYNPEEGRFVGEYQRSATNPFTRGYRHVRRISVDGDSWRVVDILSGNVPHATSRLHFHPEATVEPDGQNQFRVIRATGEPLGRLTVDPDVDTTLSRTPYFPRFGIERDRDTIEMEYAVGEHAFEISPVE